MEDTKGIVFNIQKFSVHDGGGIRTLVFLKGCPLRCRWCSNPESQFRNRQLSYNGDMCVGCGTCASVCSRNVFALNGSRLSVRHAMCLPDPDCSCTVRCKGGALGLYGEYMSAEQVIRMVSDDEVFYVRSGGGLTLGGGEPLLQADFALAILRLAHKKHIHTNIETCAAVPTETILKAAELLNSMFIDIKCIDGNKHKLWTGSNNAHILKNIRTVHDAFPNLPITIRTPVIPGFNDTEGDIEQIARFVKDCGISGHELLPYHKYGEHKYRLIGREPGMTDASLDDRKFKILQELSHRIVDGQ